jgi:HD-GYP domain-containing protein (c-di-GMP phosphodiesterase class II)
MYEGIPVSTLAVGSIVPFDLFTEIDGSSLLYRAAGDRFTKEQRNTLLESGMRDLLVRRADFERYHEYLSGILVELLRGRDELKPEPAEILETSTMVAGRVIDHPGSRSAFDMACRVIDHAIDMTGQSGSVLRCIAASTAELRELHAHSMRVCFYGLQLAHGLGISDANELSDLGVGLILHDLGKVTEHGFEPHDPSLFADHPHRGLRRLRDAPFVGPIARDVIEHHHERLDGSGLYRVPAQALSTHARIAAVADAFDRRTVATSGRSVANSFEALRAMIAEEKGAYDPKLLALFVRTLSL